MYSFDYFKNFMWDIRSKIVKMCIAGQNPHCIGQVFFQSTKIIVTRRPCLSFETEHITVRFNGLSNTKQQYPLWI